MTGATRLKDFEDFDEDDLLDGANGSGLGETALEAITVSSLTKKIKDVLNASFDFLLVKGEISGLSVVRSGHAYFTLKDEKSQIPAVMWASRFRRKRFNPQNGAKVVCFGRLEVYEPHGRYQLVVSEMEEIGVGSWEQRFRELRLKLEKEGLFSESRKKPLPLFIQRVGVATSPTGAALRDFVNTLADFSKGIDVVVAPTRVQGVGAAIEIAAALRLLNDHARELKLDAIALIRGGGSVEDLWEFNEEAAVRAVAESRVPVITGIGHEIDASLCDFAADRRALTPTAAASVIVNADFECLQDLNFWQKRMTFLVSARCQRASERLASLEDRPIFKSPGQIIWERKIDALGQTERRLSSAIAAVYNRHESRFRESVGRLEAMSPLGVLSRGYSITKSLPSGKILRKASDAKNGGVIETRLKDGILRSLVLEGGIGR